MKRLFKNRKTLYLVFGIVLVSVFSLTIVYAALNTVLKITGNADVVASNWDIHLDNVNVRSGSVGGVAPKITSPTTATFSTKLTTPGDFYEFSIDVVNDGSIDAMIDSVTKTPTLTEAQAKYLNYIIEYENGKSINIKELVEAGAFVRLKVRVEYRKDLVASDLPTSNDNLTLSFTVNYVQSDDTGSSVLNNGTLKAMVKSGTGTDAGDEICIGNECFYVISSTDNDVTMLAKYNLLVGNRYDDTNGAVPLENPTGIQDKAAIGWFSGYTVDNPLIGTITFSSANYWSDTVSGYPAYVYNENSYLYEYVENYRNYLESIGTKINEARLITREELENLGCDSSKLSCSSDAPSWVYSTSYWSGSANGDSFIARVLRSGDFKGNYIWHDDRGGIRPVITLSKNQILGIKSKVKPVANGSLGEVGTVVTIGSEQFYTIGTEGENVKLLAKYNLLVGNRYDDTNRSVPLENTTGIQDERSIGWFENYSVSNPIIGTIAFAKSNYWQSLTTTYPFDVYNDSSIAYVYLEVYKEYLQNLGIILQDIRLINYNELIGLGCSGSSCKMAPNWVYSISYWSGTAGSDNGIWHVDCLGLLRSYNYSYSGSYGVRPVIIIPKSEFE